jgi:hypothetical protein
LIPQPHGGAIRHGALPHTNGPGPGRPPSELRRRLRGALEERIGVLEAIADDVAAPARDRIRAVDTLARYGLGPASDPLVVEDVRERLRLTIAVIRQELPSELANTVLDALRTIWID